MQRRAAAGAVARQHGRRPGRGLDPVGGARERIRRQRQPRVRLGREQDRVVERVALKPTKRITTKPLSLKQVSPAGDHWINSSSCEMDTITFHVRPNQLIELHEKLMRSDSTPSPIQPFELITSIIWHIIIRIKNGPQPNTVNIIKKDIKSTIIDGTTLRNKQVVGSIKVGFPMVEAHPIKLLALIHDMTKDEKDEIGEVIGRDPGGSDFIVYGSNLTFVNWEEAKLYGFELKGLSPRFVNCFVDGIGDEGVVSILPSPIDKSEGRVVTLILPKTYMVELKEELKQWDLCVT